MDLKLYFLLDFHDRKNIRKTGRHRIQLEGRTASKTKNIQRAIEVEEEKASLPADLANT